MSRLGPIKQQRVHRQVFETLEQAIIECRLEPHALLKDRELAEDLGVSRTPVRDALHLLESSGLVEQRGSAGWVVAPLDARDIDELFELRCLLEPAGLSRIVEWPDERLEELVGMFSDFTSPMSRRVIGRYLRRDAEFHHAVIEASENRRAIRLYERVEREVDRCRHFTSYRYEGRVDQSVDEHREICDALRQRDREAAEELLLVHIRAAKDKQIELLKTHEEKLGRKGKGQ